MLVSYHTLGIWGILTTVVTRRTLAFSVFYYLCTGLGESRAIFPPIIDDLHY